MLINCVVYQEGRKLADIDKREISDYLRGPAASSGWRCKDATEASSSEMREEFDLHPLAVEDARHGHQRPKIEEYGDSALRGPAHRRGRRRRAAASARSTSSSAATSCFRSAAAREQGFQDVRARVEREPELLRNGAGYVLYALMDAVVDRYFPVLDAVETRAREDRGAALRRSLAARQHRGALLRQAAADHPQARGRPAARDHGQALRRPRAASVRGPGGIFP